MKRLYVFADFDWLENIELVGELYDVGFWEHFAHLMANQQVLIVRKPR